MDDIDSTVVQTEDLDNNVQRAINSIEVQLDEELRHPPIGIICGSGLGGLSNTILQKPRCEIDYAQIPYFPKSTVAGHLGKLVFGLFGKAQSPVVLMVGRAHYYEGHAIRALTFPIRVLKRLGVDTLIVTNAAGALNPEYAVGDLVILMDHINLAGLGGINPLRGPNADSFGVRFPALSDAYELHLRRQAHKAWRSLENTRDRNRKLHEGVYAFVGGPSYETRAECRMLKQWGADLVGMSTVPEVLTAIHSNVRVLGLSLVTNKAVLDPGPRGDDSSIQEAEQASLAETTSIGKADHGEVLEAGAKAAADVEALVLTIAEGLLTSEYPRGSRRP